MKNNVSVPKIHLATCGESLISSSGASLLLQTASVSGLATGLSQGLAPWRKPLAVHDPAKIILDMAVAVAVGGDCLADVALLRAQPEVFGSVASDPTISRLLDTLAVDVDGVLAVIGAARARARAKVWDHQSPLADDTQVIIDLDATLIGSHSEKELASPNYKRGFGFHPMMVFVDHGHGGTGEPVAALLRTGRAGANDAQDQITVLDAALAQLPQKHRQHVVVRGDSGSGVKEFVHHIHNLGLKYSVGIGGRQPFLDALEALPRQAWKKALDADGRPREGARVAELTRWLPATFTGWPDGMRVIARKERPHPGAQLRITDDNGWRITMFATNTKGGTLAQLEVQHSVWASAFDLGVSLTNRVIGVRLDVAFAELAFLPGGRTYREFEEAGLTNPKATGLNPVSKCKMRGL